MLSSLKCCPSNRGAEGWALKAGESRRRRSRVGYGVWGNVVTFPSSPSGVRPGQSPGRKRILAYFEGHITLLFEPTWLCYTVLMLWVRRIGVASYGTRSPSTSNNIFQLNSALHKIYSSRLYFVPYPYRFENVWNRQSRLESTKIGFVFNRG